MKIVLVLFLFLCTSAFGQIPANDPHWQLLWQDNFTTFDTNKWIKADNCDHKGKSTFFTANNVDNYVGNLRIRLYVEDAECNGLPVTSYVCGGCETLDHDYTSGWVESTEAYNMEFGYVEARILFPYGNGLWPAFWLWSGDRKEEIDIVELFPGKLETGNNIYEGQRHNQYINTSHLHYDVTSGSGWSTVHQDYIYPINDYNNWHTYSMEWSPNKIIIYVDGIVVNNIQNPQIYNPKPIIFSMGINSNPPPEIIPPLNGIPATMLVNWVKVYTLDSDFSNAIWTCNYDFSNHDYKVKRVISIGGSGCSNSLTSGQNITLRAKEYVIIHGDFTVPVGAELYIDCNNPCY